MTRSDGRGLRATVLAVVLAGLVLPIAAGLWHTVAAAFGHLPAIGKTEWSLEPWRQFLALPGAWTSVKLTLWTGLASTALSLLVAVGAATWCYGRLGPRAIGRLIAPFLAVPHAALAIGLAFVIAPSGWIARSVSPWATGWSVPPDLAIVHDPLGLSLILGLMVKEVPFLLLVMLAAMSQVPAAAQMRACRALGYGRSQVWLLIVFPQVYVQIRLAVYVVLSFALSVVDVGLVLGPSNPPVLAVALTRWFLAPDTKLILPASAAAIAQALIVLFAKSPLRIWAVPGSAVERAARHGPGRRPRRRFRQAAVWPSACWRSSRWRFGPSHGAGAFLQHSPRCFRSGPGCVPDRAGGERP